MNDSTMVLFCRYLQNEVWGLTKIHEIITRQFEDGHFSQVFVCFVCSSQLWSFQKQKVGASSAYSVGILAWPLYLPWSLRNQNLHIHLFELVAQSVPVRCMYATTFVVCGKLFSKAFSP